MAASLMESEPPPPPPAITTAASTAPLLTSAAHKSVQHLGKGTAKRIEEKYLKKQQLLTLQELLRLFNGPQREELLMMVDAGQRERVEAELVALALDFPPSDG